MKKLVLVATLFLFVCGGSFLAQAKSSVKQLSETTLSNDTVIADTVQTAKSVPDTAKVAE